MNAFILCIIWMVSLTWCHLFAQPMKLGIDNLVETNFEILRNKNIGLLTNSACRTSTLLPTPEAFLRTKNCTLTVLFTPEHGYYAGIPAGEYVADDSLWNIPAFSLYGKNRRPTEAMLAHCDIVVADIQDIGIRSYTFISTLLQVMDACAEYGKPLYVLDRPNPLGGILIDGNIPETLSFVCALPVPYIHGCTIGELATMANNEGWLGKNSDGKSRRCSLTVVKMKRWTRTMVWEKTGLPFIPTSPNIISPETIRCAAITGILGELSVVSIGIGTAMPFRWCGMPDIAADTLLSALAIKKNDSIIAVSSAFYPQFGKFAKTRCYGILFHCPPSHSVPYFSRGLELCRALRDVYPAAFDKNTLQPSNREMFGKVLGSKKLAEALLSGDITTVKQLSSFGIDEYRRMREKYLLYK